MHGRAPHTVADGPRLAGERINPPYLPSEGVLPFSGEFSSHLAGDTRRTRDYHYRYTKSRRQLK